MFGGENCELLFSPQVCLDLCACTCLSVSFLFEAITPWVVSHHTSVTQSAQVRCESSDSPRHKAYNQTPFSAPLPLPTFRLTVMLSPASVAAFTHHHCHTNGQDQDQVPPAASESSDPASYCYILLHTSPQAPPAGKSSSGRLDLPDRMGAPG